MSGEAQDKVVEQDAENAPVDENLDECGPHIKSVMCKISAKSIKPRLETQGPLNGRRQKRQEKCRRNEFQLRAMDADIKRQIGDRRGEVSIYPDQ